MIRIGPDQQIISVKQRFWTTRVLFLAVNGL